MGGRAESKSLKSCKVTVSKEALILAAVHLIEAAKEVPGSTPESANDEPKSFGYRLAAKWVMEEHYEKIHQWVEVNHNTVRNRHLRLCKSRLDASYTNTLLTRAQECIVLSYMKEVAS
jgi:hypothetical protein